MLDCTAISRTQQFIQDPGVPCNADAMLALQRELDVHVFTNFADFHSYPGEASRRAAILDINEILSRVEVRLRAHSGFICLSEVLG